MMISVQVPLQRMSRDEIADLIGSAMNELSSRCGGTDLNSDEEYMVEKNNMIGAVKSYKARTKLGLSLCLQACRAYRGKFTRFELTSKLNQLTHG